MAMDLVCGMMVDEKTAKFKSERMGKTYYFCSKACKTSFDRNPVKYTSGSGQTKHDGGNSCCCC